jgi:hypothetical protein
MTRTTFAWVCCIAIAAVETFNGHAEIANTYLAASFVIGAMQS